MVTVAVVFSAVVAVVVYYSAKSHYVETGETSARAIVKAVEQTVAVGLYARDDVLLQELVEGLARHPSVAGVSVRDTTGVMLASASASAPVVSGVSLASSQPPGRGKPSFQAPLTSPFSAVEPVGHLEVWLDSARIAAEARRQAILVAGALIVLLAGALGVFNTLASRLLSRPMHRLAEELALIKPGTARRLPLEIRHSHDEVGIVTAAANRLLDLQQEALQRERGMREEITALEARYRGIFDSTSAGIFILSEAGELIQANPALSQLLGRPGHALQADGATDFAQAVFLRPGQLWHLIDTARFSTLPEAADLELAREDDSSVWVHCMVSFIRDTVSGERRVEGVLYDITQRKLLEHAARHRSEHDALTGLKSRAYVESALGQQVYAARNHKGAVTLLFIDLDGFKSVNDRWGHAAGDVVLVEAARRLRTLFQRSCDIVGRLGGDELVVVITGVAATDPDVGQMAGRLVESFRIPFLLPNGELALVGASVGVASYPMHATSSRTLVHAADAAMYAVKQSGKGGFVVAQASVDWTHDGTAFWEDAFHPAGSEGAAPRDPLTGLMDRRRLVEQLGAEHSRVSGGGRPVGVICLDIDSFRLVNVAHGSKAGDEVLCEAAHRFGTVLRRGDTIARTGSDEFVVVVVSEGDDEEPRNLTEAVARKLLASLVEPFRLSACNVTVNASVGISLLDAHTADGLDVLREAQLALRRSKAQGRSSLVFFEHDMMTGVHDRLTLEEDLRVALGTGQLFLLVQPQVDRAGALAGGEALLRWSHPIRGMVPPDQFIPLAESCGVIVELGAWVLQEGCRILKNMRSAGGAQTLAINISPIQFSHPDFVAHVQHALAASGAPAEGLILEITEGVLITDVAHVTERLRELVDIGVRFSIDDFGTGFSSLGYLRQLPLYEIKIDRSFIAGLPSDVASAGIVCSILSMGSHLGLHVVAEGVETPEQSAFLSHHGCPSQQGWLHGRPMSPADFESLAGTLPDAGQIAVQGAESVMER